MGYSCTAAAAYALERVAQLLQAKADAELSATHPSRSLDPLSKGELPTNIMPDGGFWERGREHDDGAITGCIWRAIPTNPAAVRKGGTFRINPDGTIARWPGLPRSYWYSVKVYSDACMAKAHPVLTVL